MLPKIILYEPVPKDLLERLEQHTDVTVVETFEGLSEKALHTLLSGAEGLIGVGETIGPKILDRAPRLKVVSTISVGYDYFDVADLTRRGIMLMHTPDVLTDTTADMIFMLMLCAARRAVEMDEMVRQGRWTETVGRGEFRQRCPWENARHSRHGAYRPCSGQAGIWRFQHECPVLQQVSQ